jgi:hypothetical protein
VSGSISRVAPAALLAEEEKPVRCALVQAARAPRLEDGGRAVEAAAAERVDRDGSGLGITCGILSLGHFAFFRARRYMIGMWLMYARTRGHRRGVARRRAHSAQLTPNSWTSVGVQIFWRGRLFRVFPPSGRSPDSLALQLALVVARTQARWRWSSAWLAFRSRVTGVYLSILTQADDSGARSLSISER